MRDQIDVGGDDRMIGPALVEDDVVVARIFEGELNACEFNPRFFGETRFDTGPAVRIDNQLRAHLALNPRETLVDSSGKAVGYRPRIPFLVTDLHDEALFPVV